MATDHEQDERGASPNERLLAAARADDIGMLLDVFENGEKYDINHVDGLGNTALHLAAVHGSLEVLDYILFHEGCDVDLLNRLEKATPLHLATRIEDPEVKLHVMENLMDAGADTNIKDKYGRTVLELVNSDDAETLALVRKYRAQTSISRHDVASDDDDDNSDGSGSD